MAAEAAFHRSLSQPVPLVTTTFALLECGNAAARRPYRNEADELQHFLESRGELITPTVEDWRLAWEAYRCREAANAGIVDCTSFVVMHRMGLTDAFTNDHHFAATGLTTLF